jgi:hypothetical protein
MDSELSRLLEDLLFFDDFLQRTGPFGLINDQIAFNDNQIAALSRWKERKQNAARAGLLLYLARLRERKLGRSRVQQRRSQTAIFARDLGVRGYDKRTMGGRKNRRVIARRFRLVRSVVRSQE